MTNFLSHWRRPTAGGGCAAVIYESRLWLESEIFPGVEFSIRKMSLAQRIELSSRVRELTLKNEFLRAGDASDQIDAKLADLLVAKLYVQWAVSDLRGLTIDGQGASVEMLLDNGPEQLVLEMCEAISVHLELSEAERKNF